MKKKIHQPCEMFCISFSDLKGINNVRVFFKHIHYYLAFWMNSIQNSDGRNDHMFYLIILISSFLKKLKHIIR